MRRRQTWRKGQSQRRTETVPGNYGNGRSEAELVRGGREWTKEAQDESRD